jgi:hypothetical protein
MTDEECQQILNRAKIFFKEEIVSAHIHGGLDRAQKLKNYNIHPFLLKYLANFIEGNDDPRSIAKALIYPRILGTSITTIFGSKAQKMINDLFAGLGSAIPGIDIEFIDGVDGRKKYCQLKAGPNTINKDDVKTVIDHFTDIKHIARQNRLDLRLDDLMVGIIYGDETNLSTHYNTISKQYPVLIGSNFWYHLTGRENFYTDLIEAIGEVAIEIDGKDKLESAIDQLAKDIGQNI